MSPELLARRWLRLDALYCGAAGVIALGACIPLARLFHVPTAAIAAAGAATVVWAWLLARLAQRREWRHPLAVVAAANAGAAATVAALAAVAPALAARLLLAAVCVEVATFAAVQLRTLRRR